MRLAVVIVEVGRFVVSLGQVGRESLEIVGHEDRLEERIRDLIQFLPTGRRRLNRLVKGRINAVQTGKFVRVDREQLTIDQLVTIGALVRVNPQH